MKELNYEKIGLKSGLEIHQQLDSSKLFCNCKSILRKDEPDFLIKRKLHAVAGESGKVDKAAKYQASLEKEFIYEGYDSICLVELDEEPPHKINNEALKIAIEISLLLNCKIIPITQIMRKTVIDGSNTTGFQRTVLIAKNGFVETEFGKVRIESVFLEEDAARIIGGEKGEKIYRLDRLGIPLVEIVTAPDIKTPIQAKEVALKIGNILRSSKVRRGLGTIRQDINVSINNHPRVEIKGFQDPKIFVEVINKEIIRQQNELKTKKKLNEEVRGANNDATTKFLRPLPGSARMYPETDLPILKISRDLVNSVKKNLPKLRSEIKQELKNKGLSEEMIKLLFKQNKLEEFRELYEIIKNPSLIARVLLILPKEISKKENKSLLEIEKILNKDVLIFILENIENKKITSSQIKEVMIRIVSGENLKKAIKFKKEDSNFIEEKIHNIIKTKPGLSEKAYMGLIMREFKGKINGKDAMEIIKKFIN